MLLRAGEVAMIGTAEEVGNEYIYQNMSDEEKRLVKEQEAAKIKAEKGMIEVEKETENLSDKAREDERKNNVAEVTKIEFVDKGGKTKNIFETGENIRIIVTNQFNKATTDPIFGIVVKNDRGVTVFVTNTRFKQIKTGCIGKGTKEITYEIENRLTSGTYLVSPAIADTYAKIFYDWQNNLKSFGVINKEYTSDGVCDLKHDIFIK